MVAAQQAICRHFATLLSYPDGEARQVAATCAELLRTSCPEAAAPLRSFIDFLATEETARVEELFTATFDLQPACHPYVGYQLCGESQQRTMFLIKLQQLYRQHGFQTGAELPDHLGTLLRFIGTVADRNCCAELVGDGLLPSLEKMLQGLNAGEHPYADLLRALQNFLTATVAGGGRLSVVARPKEECS
jgi:nitrate reductase delta subunit